MRKVYSILAVVMTVVSICSCDRLLKKREVKTVDPETFLNLFTDSDISSVSSGLQLKEYGYEPAATVKSGDAETVVFIKKCKYDSQAHKVSAWKKKSGVIEVKTTSDGGEVKITQTVGSEEEYREILQMLKDRGYVPYPSDGNGYILDDGEFNFEFKQVGNSWIIEGGPLMKVNPHAFEPVEYNYSGYLTNGSKQYNIEMVLNVSDDNEITGYYRYLSQPADKRIGLEGSFNDSLGAFAMVQSMTLFSAGKTERFELFLDDDGANGDWYQYSNPEDCIISNSNYKTTLKVLLREI